MKLLINGYLFYVLGLEDPILSRCHQFPHWPIITEISIKIPVSYLVDTGKLIQTVYMEIQRTQNCQYNI